MLRRYVHRRELDAPLRQALAEVCSDYGIAGLILRLMKSDLEPDVRNEATGEIRSQYLAAEKARRVLGWKPLFTLEEGLTRTIEWYEALIARQR